jgi:hypothetical protein
MPAFAFDQNDGKIASAKGKTLLDASRHGYLNPAARNTLPLAEHPHGSGAVVYLKDASAHRAEGIGYSPCDRDLPASESAWVAVNLLYAFARGTSRKQHCRETNQQHRKQFEASARHTHSPKNVEIKRNKNKPELRLEVVGILARQLST